MNFTIDRDLLLQNLTHVSKALSAKIQMPGLAGIKFNVNKDFVLLTGSNNEISIQAKISSSNQLQVVEEGEFIVQGKYLLEIIKRITSKEVDFISYEDNAIKILAEKSNFTLNCLQLDSFPAISFADSALNITLDAINVKQLIRKTTFATSISESRPILTGISFISNTNKLEVVATDSYRLAKKYITNESGYPEINVVIPGKNLDELFKILEDTDENVEIHCTSTKILFKYRNLLFQSRLINGVYPNVDVLIPNKFITNITFDKEKLISSIERVAIFVTNELSNIIKMSLNSDGVVELSSITNQIGDAKDEIMPLDCTDSFPMEIAFSAKYFLEALRSFDSSKITIHFTGEIKPFTITGDKDYNLIQLILPVRAA